MQDTELWTETQAGKNYKNENVTFWSETDQTPLICSVLGIWETGFKDNVLQMDPLL